MTDNPFDAFDGDLIPSSGTLEPGPRPSMGERFTANVREGFVNTIFGAAVDLAAPGEPSTRARQKAAWDAMPQWETPLEAAMSLSGQIVGGAPSIENMVPIGVGARVVGTAGMKATGLGARMLAGATDAAITNVATDPIVQGLQIAGGTRDTYDPVQTTVAAPIGAIIGGGVPLVGAAIGKVADRLGRPVDTPAARSEAPSSPGLAPAPREDAMPIIEPGAASKAPAATDGAASPLPKAETTVSAPPSPNQPAPVDGAPRASEPAPIPEPTPERPDAIRAAAEDVVGPDASFGDKMAAEAAIRDGRPVDRQAERSPTTSTALSTDAPAELTMRTGAPSNLSSDLETFVTSAPPDIAAKRRAALNTRTDDIASVGDLGPVLTGYEGRFGEAVARLQAFEAGDARGVFMRTETGPIDVPWGHYDTGTGVGAGLAKILAKHPDAVERLPALIEQGTITKGPTRAIIDHDGYRAVVRLDFDGRAKTWLLTAYEKIDRRAGGTPESPGGRQAGSHSSPTSPAGDSIARTMADPPGAAIDDGSTLAMRSGKMTGEMARSTAGVAETAADTSPPFVRLKDASDALIEALDPAAVRQGRLPPISGIQGIYKTGPGVVRVRNTQDFSVLTHELGHHLEVAVGKPIQSWMTANRKVLEPLAYAGAAKGSELKEGFAEMARLFVTNLPYLDRTVPGLSASFETALKQQRPDLLSALVDARTAWVNWAVQPSARAVASTIVSAKRADWIERGREALGDVKGTLAEFFSTAYTRLFDDLHPIAVTVRELTRLARDRVGKPIELKAVDDAYKLARMARGAYSVGHADIQFGVTPYHGSAPVSASLRDALIAAQGGGNVFSKVREETLADFGSYLWSRRALGEWGRHQRGEIPNPPDKLTMGDHEINVREMEAKHPAFVSAAEKVYDWNRALWDKKLDAGLITGEQHAEGLKIVDYVPGLRHFDETEAKMPSRGAGPNGKGAMVRRFLGSDRDVINPVDSLVADAYQTAMAIARNDAVKALGRLGDLAGNGGGRFVERIPRLERKAMEVDTDQVIEQMARELGLSRRDAQSIRDAIIDLAPGSDLPERLTTFKQALTTERGEAIVWYREGGELVPLRLADGKFGAEVVGALNAMTRDEKAFLLEVLSKPAAALRMGVTTHPTFLVANFARDQMVTAILFGKPFERLKLSLKGFADDLFGREAAQSYIRAGGITGGASTATLAEARIGRDTAAATLSGVRYRLGTFKGVVEASESAETASRLGNFGVFHREAKARGLDDWEASFEAAYRARDVLDFDRRGSGTMAIARIIPFLNASIQGLDKAARELFVPAAKKLSDIVLTKEDERQLDNSLRAWGRLAVATVATMGLWAIVSRRPDAEEVDPRIRATHWVVPNGDGSWTTIPKPFELAAVLNIGEFTWDALAKRDPTSAHRYLSGLFDVLSPPSLLEGNPLLKTAYELKSNTDFFTGQPIVPPDMQALEPFLQYNHRTSALAKSLGAAADISPLKLDHVITGFGGSWGRSLLSLSDWASGEKPSTGWAEAIFTRRFIKDASRGSSSVAAFWDLVSQRTGTLEGALKTYRALSDEGRTGEAGAYIGRQDDDTRAYVAAQLVPGKRGEPASALHPLVRARSAALAIGGLMRDLSDGGVTLADGAVQVSAVDRRRALDVLSDLKMAEARNALVQVGASGFAKTRTPISTDGYLSELVAVSPEIAQALADRYRTARVLKQEAVDAAWPELRTRLLAEGTSAEIRDLTAAAWGRGFELDGRRMKKRTKPALPGG